MRLQNNSNGFGLVGIVMIALALGVIGGAGWYVWQNQKETENTASGNSPITVQEKDEVTVSGAKLTDGWVLDVAEPSMVGLENERTDCFIRASVASDAVESNSTEAELKQQTLEGLRGYEGGVEELPDTTLSIVRKGETVQLDAQTVKVGGDKASFSNYAYVTEPDIYIYVHLSCPNESDLSSAQVALLAVNFKR